MAQLAAAGDLATRLDATFTPTQTSRADDLLRRASDVVDGYCRAVSFERVVDDTVALAGTWERRLWLPGGPVESVASVMTDGAVDTHWAAAKGWLVRRAGWNGPDSVWTVTYTHGYLTPPGDVVEVVLAMAARVFVNPGGLEQERAGAWSGVYFLGLTAQEQVTLARYRDLPT